MRQLCIILEDPRQVTFNEKCLRHVVMECTGFYFVRVSVLQMATNLLQLLFSRKKKKLGSTWKDAKGVMSSSIKRLGYLKI